MRLFFRLLSKGGADGGSDHAALLDVDASKCIAHEVNGAALPGSAEHLADRFLQTLMRVADHQLDAAQRPERFGLRGQNRYAENFAASVRVRADAIITAKDTILPPCRLLTYVASIHT